MKPRVAIYKMPYRNIKEPVPIMNIMANVFEFFGDTADKMAERLIGILSSTIDHEKFLIVARRFSISMDFLEAWRRGEPFKTFKTIWK